MNDRELLELAAKASGRDGDWVDFAGMDVRVGYQGGLLCGDDDSGYYWNPLRDDGDALRLAVKLHIDPHWSHLGYATALHMPLRAAPTVRVEEYGSDPCAATRRAIVRAAAEIGRMMP